VEEGNSRAPETLGAGDFAAAAKLLRLLAEPVRLALVYRLASGDADRIVLTQAASAPAAIVSQQLARLRLAGLVTSRKQGKQVMYSLPHPEYADLVLGALNSPSARDWADTPTD
jgi:DNA-binding transcriptional ArsR family regulator